MTVEAEAPLRTSTGRRNNATAAAAHASLSSSVPGLTTLMASCQNCNELEVRSLLQQKPQATSMRDRTGKTALHYCAENLNTGCASLLLAQDSNLLNVQDEEGYTALHLAVISGNRTLVHFLIDKGADVNCVDNEKHSSIHWATVCGELEILESLVESGGIPSTPDIHGAYPIHYAAQMCGPNSEMGNDIKTGLAVLKKLISFGVSVSVEDKDGRQPVLWAASAETRPSKTYCPTGSSEAILELINAGAEVEARDKDGLTALHCAASRGHVDCVETLVSLCEAVVDAEDGNSCTPLFYAVTLGHADCVQLLLKYGALPNKQDRKGRTAAHCGASKGQLETLKLLYVNGANLWMRNAKGDLPLHEAIQSGRKELVSWLLALQPTAVSATNSNGRTPLHIAAIADNVEMCKILMDNGADVNPVMKTSKGVLMTPLDAAVHRGNHACAKYLLLHGALPFSKITDAHDVESWLHHNFVQQKSSADYERSERLVVLDESQSKLLESSVQTDSGYFEQKEMLGLQLRQRTADITNATAAATAAETSTTTPKHILKTYRHQQDNNLDLADGRTFKQAIITNVYVKTDGDCRSRHHRRTTYKNFNEEAVSDSDSSIIDLHDHHDAQKKTKKTTDTTEAEVVEGKNVKITREMRQGEFTTPDELMSTPEQKLTKRSEQTTEEFHQTEYNAVIDNDDGNEKMVQDELHTEKSEHFLHHLKEQQLLEEREQLEKYNERSDFRENIVNEKEDYKQLNHMTKTVRVTPEMRDATCSPLGHRTKDFGGGSFDATTICTQDTASSPTWNQPERKSESSSPIKELTDGTRVERDEKACETISVPTVEESISPIFEFEKVRVTTSDQATSPEHDFVEEQQNALMLQSHKRDTLDTRDTACETDRLSVHQAEVASSTQDLTAVADAACSPNAQQQIESVKETNDSATSPQQQDTTCTATSPVDQPGISKTKVDLVEAAVSPIEALAYPQGKEQEAAETKNMMTGTETVEVKNAGIVTESLSIPKVDLVDTSSSPLEIAKEEKSTVDKGCSPIIFDTDEDLLSRNSSVDIELAHASSATDEERETTPLAHIGELPRELPTYTDTSTSPINTTMKSEAVLAHPVSVDENTSPFATFATKSKGTATSSTPVQPDIAERGTSPIVWPEQAQRSTALLKLTRSNSKEQSPEAHQPNTATDSNGEKEKEEPDKSKLTVTAGAGAPDNQHLLPLLSAERSPVSSVRSGLKDSGFSDRHDDDSSADETADDMVEKRHKRLSRRDVLPPNQLPVEADSRSRSLDVTRAIQENIRRYRLEHKLFSELQELKRNQIRSGKTHENVLVKRLVDNYRATVLQPGMRDYQGAYTFRDYERYLYAQLRDLSLLNEERPVDIAALDNESDVLSGRVSLPELSTVGKTPPLPPVESGSKTVPHSVVPLHSPIPAIFTVIRAIPQGLSSPREVAPLYESAKNRVFPSRPKENEMIGSSSPEDTAAQATLTPRKRLLKPLERVQDTAGGVLNNQAARLRLETVRRNEQQHEEAKREELRRQEVRRRQRERQAAAALERRAARLAREAELEQKMAADMDVGQTEEKKPDKVKTSPKKQPTSSAMTPTASTSGSATATAKSDDKKGPFGFLKKNGGRQSYKSPIQEIVTPEKSKESNDIPKKTAERKRQDLQKSPPSATSPQSSALLPIWIPAEGENPELFELEEPAKQKMRQAQSIEEQPTEKKENQDDEKVNLEGKSRDPYEEEDDLRIPRQFVDLLEETSSLSDIPEESLRSTSSQSKDKTAENTVEALLKERVDQQPELASDGSESNALQTESDESRCATYTAEHDEESSETAENITTTREVTMTKDEKTVVDSSKKRLETKKHEEVSLKQREETLETKKKKTTESKQATTKSSTTTHLKTSKSKQTTDTVASDILQVRAVEQPLVNRITNQPAHSETKKTTSQPDLKKTRTRDRSPKTKPFSKPPLQKPITPASTKIIDYKQSGTSSKATDFLDNQRLKEKEQSESVRKEKAEKIQSRSASQTRQQRHGEEVGEQLRDVENKSSEKLRWKSASGRTKLVENDSVDEISNSPPKHILSSTAVNKDLHSSSEYEHDLAAHEQIATADTSHSEGTGTTAGSSPERRKRATWQTGQVAMPKVQESEVKIRSPRRKLYHQTASASSSNEGRSKTTPVASAKDALIDRVSKTLQKDQVQLEDLVTVRMVTTGDPHESFTRTLRVGDLLEATEEDIVIKTAELKPENVSTTDDDGATSVSSSDFEDILEFEIRHGREKNIFWLPTNKIKENRKWQVTFIVGKESIT